MLEGILTLLGIVAAGKAKTLVEEKAADLVKGAIGISINKENMAESLSKLTPDQISGLKTLFEIEVKKAQAEIEERKADSSDFQSELKDGEDLKSSYKDEFITWVIGFYIPFSVLAATLISKDVAIQYVTNFLKLLNSPYGVTLIIVVASALGARHILIKLANVLLKVIQKKFDL